VQRLAIPRLLARGSSVVTTLPPVSAEYVFGRAELTTIAARLRVCLRDRKRAIGSPDQLRSAVEEAFGPWGDGGTVHVHRIPGALHTAETWHLRLESVRPEARQLVESLIAEARSVR
jgi:hypothetical protein